MRLLRTQQHIQILDPLCPHIDLRKTGLEVRDLAIALHALRCSADLRKRPPSTETWRRVGTAHFRGCIAKYARVDSELGGSLDLGCGCGRSVQRK